MSAGRTARRWLHEGRAGLLVTIERARGSTPREAGAAMLVGPDAVAGTIGGGQLEWLAIAHARAMLAGETRPPSLDVPLGPALGQCCGGHVVLRFSPLDAAALAELEAGETAGPAVLIVGAGHTGRALARALKPLAFAVRLVDSRPELAADPAVTVLAVPEQAVEAAPPGSAVLAMTHLHSLDFLIAGAGLARGDLAYVGMIGSATKRVMFARWLADEHPGVDAAPLRCPIGAAPVRDKRPEVIAALTAAELLVVQAADAAHAAGRDGTGGQPASHTGMEPETMVRQMAGRRA